MIREQAVYSDVSTTQCSFTSLLVFFSLSFPHLFFFFRIFCLLASFIYLRICFATSRLSGTCSVVRPDYDNNSSYVEVKVRGNQHPPLKADFLIRQMLSPSRLLVQHFYFYLRIYFIGEIFP